MWCVWKVSDKGGFSNKRQWWSTTEGGKWLHRSNNEPAGLWMVQWFHAKSSKHNEQQRIHWWFSIYTGSMRKEWTYFSDIKWGRYKTATIVCPLVLRVESHKGTRATSGVLYMQEKQHLKHMPSDHELSLDQNRNTRWLWTCLNWMCRSMVWFALSALKKKQ